MFATDVAVLVLDPVVGVVVVAELLALLVVPSTVVVLSPSPPVAELCFAADFFASLLNGG